MGCELSFVMSVIRCRESSNRACAYATGETITLEWLALGERCGHVKAQSQGLEGLAPGGRVL